MGGSFLKETAYFSRYETLLKRFEKSFTGNGRAVATHRYSD